MFGVMTYSKYLILIRFVAAILFAAITSASFAGIAAAKDPAVTGVRLGVNDGKTRVVLDLTKATPYSAFLLENPYRLVIDLPELDWGVNGDTGAAARGVVEGMRYGLFRAGNSRVVVDLKGPVRIVAHSALAKPDRLMFDLLPVPASKYKRGQTVALNNWKPPTGKAIPVPRAKKAGDARRIVIIDAGHGGVDPGAVRGNIHEKRITMAVAEEVRRQLNASKRYRVVMTRNRDIFVELRDRVKLAQDNEGDIFISLHADTHPKRKTRGASIYTLSERASDKEAARLARKENASDLVGGLDLSPYSKEVTGFLLDLTRRRTMEESSVFANMMIAQFRKKKINMQPYKTHRFAGFAVLKAPDVPSVLIEMGYLSNKTDRKMLQAKGFRKKVARAILAGLDDYFKHIDDLAAR
jgi:N-acetylmuramoyl-L-alanine amidase